MQFKDELNPIIWDKDNDNQMRPEVNAKLREIADAFIEYIEIPEEALIDVVVTGSSASYNYNEHSDLDLHIIVDYEKIHEDCPLVEGYLGALKNTFNKEHDIFIKDIPVELYAEKQGQGTVHNGLYSVWREEWIDRPEKIAPTDNDAAVEAKYQEIKEMVDKCNDSETATELLEKIYTMRKAGLAEAGEFCTENLAFKKLRNEGCMDKLRQIKKEQIDKQLSLESYNESNERTFADWFGKDLTGQTYEGNLVCTQQGLTSLKGSPEIVTGYFCCDKNELVSLDGAPKYVGDRFDCRDNKLINLKGGPKEVGECFFCDYNKLESLEGAPEKVGHSFSCYHNQLTSLKGSPRIVSYNFDCGFNNLVTLEGAPEEVGYDFSCMINDLNSLEGAPKVVGGNFKCSRNPKLKSLTGIGKVGGKIYTDIEEQLKLESDNESIKESEDELDLEEKLIEICKKDGWNHINGRAVEMLEKDTMYIDLYVDEVDIHQIHRKPVTMPLNTEKDLQKILDKIKQLSNKNESIKENKMNEALDLTEKDIEQLTKHFRKTYSAEAVENYIESLKREFDNIKWYKKANWKDAYHFDWEPCSFEEVIEGTTRLRALIFALNTTLRDPRSPQELKGKHFEDGFKAELPWPEEFNFVENKMNEAEGIYKPSLILEAYKKEQEWLKSLELGEDERAPEIMLFIIENDKIKDTKLIKREDVYTYKPEENEYYLDMFRDSGDVLTDYNLEPAQKLVDRWNEFKKEESMENKNEDVATLMDKVDAADAELKELIKSLSLREELESLIEKALEE